MSTAEKTLYTPDDLLLMSDGDRYELINGELVEMPVSEESNLIAGWISYLLNSFVLRQRSGLVIPEQTYQCFPNDPNRVRRPDVSYIRAERRPGGPLRHGHTPDAPDLVIEVVSPNDVAYDLEEKLEDYRSAGVPLVWVVYPNRRKVFIYAGGSEVPFVLHETETLTGGDVLPGFSVKVSDLFPKA